MILPYHRSLSIKADSILREVLTEIVVKPAYSEENGKVFRGVALWDTGATNSAITDKTAGEL